MKRKFEFEYGEGEGSTLPNEGILKIRKQQENKKKTQAAEERVMCGIWTLPMVIYLIKKLDQVRKNKTRTRNVQFLQPKWDNITKAINKKKFKCATSGECQECGTYVVLITQQVRDKYYKMKLGCQDLVEILDNPKYKNDRKRWLKISNCTLTKSVSSSSAKALTADSVSSSCAIGPNTSLLAEESNSLISKVWKAVAALGLERQLKFKAMTLVHAMDEKMMQFFLEFEQSDQRLYVEDSKCNN